MEDVRSIKPMRVMATAALGVGAMVGAGIFALMGEAGAIAGSAVYLSFIIAGGVALLSGYSMAHLGVRYPAAGGIVEYLAQAYGVGTLSGALSVLLYLSALVALALIAKAFGSYAAALLPVERSSVWVNGLADLVVIGFVIINLEGSRRVAASEQLIVGIKLLVLAAFAVAGLWYADPARLSPETYPPLTGILYSLAITFFAFEGFRVMTNAAEDMPDPAHTLPRAMYLAISVVIVLYVAVALAVFGSLDASDVIRTKDYALAEAARPAFGNAGFALVAIGALISTASAINANLYAVTNVTYQLAKEGELPDLFGRPIAHSREGLLVSAAAIIGLVSFFQLAEIAAIGSTTILIVHLAVHIGHLRIRRETGAALPILVLAILATVLTLVFSAVYLAQASPITLWLVAGILILALTLEGALQRIKGRHVTLRIER